MKELAFNFIFHSRATIIWGILALAIAVILTSVSRWLFEKSSLQKAKIGKTDLFVVLLAIALLGRGIIFNAQIAVVVGIVLLLVGIVFWTSDELKTDDQETVKGCVVGGAIGIPALIYRDWPLTFAGILIVLVVLFFKKKSTLANKFLLITISATFIVAGGGSRVAASVMLKDPFLKVDQHLMLGETDVTGAVSTNPNQKIQAIYKGKVLKVATSDDLGQGSIDFNKPGIWKLAVTKDGQTITKKVMVASSDEYEDHQAEIKLAENNRHGIKEKLTLEDAPYTVQKNGENGYKVEIKGKTSPNTNVEVDYSDDHKADKKGNFKFDYSLDSNEDRKIRVYVLSAAKTKENSKLVEVKKNPDIAEPVEEPSESDDSSSTPSSNSSKSSKAEEAAAKMNANFDHGTVSYDRENKVIKVTPNDPDFVAAASAMEAGTADPTEWIKMTNNFDELSERVSDAYGLHDMPLVIVNPVNPDKILYEAVDGECVYDFVRSD